MIDSSSIKLHFNREFLESIEGYIHKTGAGTLGFFVLEALSFNLENHGRGPLDITACCVEHAHIRIPDNWGRPQLSAVEVTLRFTEGAQEKIIEFVQSCEAGKDPKWVANAIKCYSNFIDSRSKAGNMYYLPPKPIVH